MHYLYIVVEWLRVTNYVLGCCNNNQPFALDSNGFNSEESYLGFISLHGIYLNPWKAWSG